MNPPPYESNRRSDYHSSTTLPPGEPNLTTYVPSYHTGLFKSAAPLPMPGETPPGYNEHSPIRELMMYVFEKGRMIIKEYKKLTSNSQLANIKNLGERVSECLDKIEQLYRNEPGLDAYLASKNKDGIKKKLMEIKMDLLHIQSSFSFFSICAFNFLLSAILASRAFLIFSNCSFCFSVFSFFRLSILSKSSYFNLKELTVFFSSLIDK